MVARSREKGLGAQQHFGFKQIKTQTFFVFDAIAQSTLKTCTLAGRAKTANSKRQAAEVLSGAEKN
eukprot:1216551-Amphidinium_carterae.1